MIWILTTLHHCNDVDVVDNFKPYRKFQFYEIVIRFLIFDAFLYGILRLQLKKKISWDIWKVS